MLGPISPVIQFPSRPPLTADDQRGPSAAQESPRLFLPQLRRGLRVSAAFQEGRDDIA